MRKMTGSRLDLLFLLAVIAALLAPVAAGGAHAAETGTANAPAEDGSGLPVVVLKLDDFDLSEPVHDGWIMVMDHLNERNMVGTVGIFSRGNSGPHPDAVTWLIERQNEGHEIWNHGLCHCRPETAQPPDGKKGAEFRGTSLEHQTAALQRTQKIAETYLGAAPTTFGAPYNSTDANTAQALAAIPEIEIWMFKETDIPTDKFVLERVNEVNIEYPVHVPGFDQFRNGFEAHSDADVLVIQGHPRSWVDNPQHFDEFTRIVDYLQEQGARVMSPSGYLDLTKTAAERTD